MGDGKTRIAIWLSVMVKLQKAMILINKHEHCTFKSPVIRCFVYCITGETVIFLPFRKCPLLAENECAFSISLILFKPMQKSTPVLTLQTRGAVIVNWWVDKKIIHCKNVNSKIYLFL